MLSILNELSDYIWWKLSDDLLYHRQQNYFCSENVFVILRSYIIVFFLSIISKRLILIAICTFFLQSNLQYQILGQYPAPDFFSIDQSTGVIYISRDLRLDSLQLATYNVSRKKDQINFQEQGLLTSCRLQTIYLN